MDSNKAYYYSRMWEWANQYFNAKEHHCPRVAEARMRKMADLTAGCYKISKEIARDKLEHKGWLNKFKKR